jgi:hypothetical protein
MQNYVDNETPINDLTHLIIEQENLPRQDPDSVWVFRGESFRKNHNRNHWTLQPSLERAGERYGKQDGSELEYWLLREFKRRLHHYGAPVPPDWDTVEWLSLMQHHGAPTRMLDWTYSPFVAAFNALKTQSKDYEAIIWCCDSRWFTKRSTELLKTAGVQVPEKDDPFRQDGTVTTSQFFDIAFGANIEPQLGIPKALHSFVCPINSYRLNERLTIQQGLFLVPGNISLSFHENLVAMDPGREHFRLWVLQKGDDNATNHQRMLQQLNRMNVTEATLYPGLDGFARSLKLNWRIIGR